MSEETQPPAQGTTQPGEGTQTPPQPDASKQNQDGKPGDGGSATQPNDAKTKTDGKTERVIPEKYDLKMPDGSVIDPKHLESVTEYAKANKLTNEEAQAILNRDSGLLKSFVEAQQEQLAQAGNKWIEDAKNDKEIGGDAFTKNVELAKRVVEKFGTDQLKTDLEKTGLGNHPELVRLLVRVGKTMSEDQFVPAGSQAGSKRSAVDIFYGNKPTENKGE